MFWGCTHLTRLTPFSQVCAWCDEVPVVTSLGKCRYTRVDFPWVIDVIDNWFPLRTSDCGNVRDGTIYPMIIYNHILMWYVLLFVP